MCGRGRRVDGPFARRTSRVEVGRHRLRQKPIDRRADCMAQGSHRYEDGAPRRQCAPLAERDCRTKETAKTESRYDMGLRRSACFPSGLGNSRVEDYQEDVARHGRRVARLPRIPSWSRYAVVQQGTPIETVAKVLRHGSGSEVTLKYYVEVEEETKAAALQSLPRKIEKAK